jgi:HTH-type transcriptional regulator/antitoxin HigA
VYYLLVSFSSIISSDRQAREISATVAQIENALSSEQVLKSIVEGLPREAIDGIRRSLTAERRDLLDTLETYDKAKQGDFEPMRKRAGEDPGALLVVARITKGWSQKELARKLGLREQAIQRYEAERYRSISLAGLLRVARALSVVISTEIAPKHENWISKTHQEMSPSEGQRLLKHARLNRWLDSDNSSDENALSQLVKHVAEHVGEHGTPSLLRTGINVTNDHFFSDWLLLSWKAQVTRRAKSIIQRNKPQYRPLDISWLKDLVRLSQFEDGPRRAIALLIEHGIIALIEPHIVSMKVDGAAFLVDDIPVIGLTLLRDSIDNFWFTLLHEVAHVILHYRTGLRSGFFDDLEMMGVDEFEEEANRFAENLLIPEELWSRSPARISKTIEPVEHLADRLGISPAIIFGRIMLERKDYALFSKMIGQGTIRSQFNLQDDEVKYAPDL